MASSLHRGPLFTDLYQLTMAQVYFSHGMADLRAGFEHYFRTYPDYGEHRAGFCVSAGVGALVDRLRTLRFSSAELSVLGEMRAGSGAPLFRQDFLGWLSEQRDFGCLRIQAAPDGRVVHPHTPITVVEGPLGMGQLLETVLLNHRNYATLIATKAARIKQAARTGTVLEFGMRRAAGTGANLATEAALIGGADHSSNVGASLRAGSSPRGTHAHSLVQAFMAAGGDELDAFRAFAQVYPDDCVLLVDTIDTLESGLPNAITVFEDLRCRGHRPVGIRLDSGDPVVLARHAARMLDRAGFPDTKIVLSDRLDEVTIARITASLAKNAEDPDRLIGRLVFGVGTRLVTSQGSPSLDGVYKLAALRHEGAWSPAFKFTDDPAKSALPGRKRLWRRYGPDQDARSDLVTLAGEEPQSRDNTTCRSLLEVVWEDGVGARDTIDTARRRLSADLARLLTKYRSLIEPEPYPVRQSRGLRELGARIRERQPPLNGHA